MVQKEHIPIVLVSRNLPYETAKITKRLELKKQGIYVIALHGACVVDLHSKEVIVRNCIPYEDQRRLYRLAQQHGMFLAYRNEDGWVSDYAANPILQKTAGQHPVYEDFDFLDDDQELEEIWILQEKEKLDAIEAILKREAVVHFCRIHEEAIVCTSRHSDEAQALSALMQHLHVTYEDTVIIGSGLCDEMLFPLGQHKVAMMNADLQMPKKDAMLTVSRDEDGVVNALEKLTDFVEIIYHSVEIQSFFISHVLRPEM